MAPQGQPVAMGERETVTEVRAEAALEVAVPLALGSNVGQGVADLLRSADAVRHVADVDVRDVEKTEVALAVDAVVALTVHLPHPFEGDEAAAVRSALADLDAVVAVDRVDVREAYPVEAY